MNILETLRTQRWDDHRYYHHSRINQFLHLISACSFLVAYVYLFIDPVVSSFIAWLVAMMTRQAGHFFFEPKGYDEYNKATFNHKEDIKVGFNLNRKRILLSCWLAVPLLAYFDATTMNLLVPQQDTKTFFNRVGMGWLWLGILGVAFRSVQLMVKENFETAITWVIKILTDPFHDVMIYRKSPLYLMKGQLIDPDLRQDYE